MTDFKRLREMNSAAGPNTGVTCGSVMQFIIEGEVICTLDQLLDHIDELQQMCEAFTKELDDGERVSRLLDERDRLKEDQQSKTRIIDAGLKATRSRVNRIGELGQYLKKADETILELEQERDELRGDLAFSKEFGRGYKATIDKLTAERDILAQVVKDGSYTQKALADVASTLLDEADEKQKTKEAEHDLCSNPYCEICGGGPR